MIPQTNDFFKCHCNIFRHQAFEKRRQQRQSHLKALRQSNPKLAKAYKDVYKEIPEMEAQDPPSQS